MYREGWKQEEIRVAIDGPSGAHEDDPEQAGDSEPEKVHGQGKRQPAEVRSRAEYYEELRATDKQMAASDGRSDRPPLNSLHVTPERITTPNRVRPEDLDGMRSMAGGGEWQELVDLLIASLALTQAPVTAGERDELRSLAEAMDLPTGPLAGLNVQG